MSKDTNEFLKAAGVVVGGFMSIPSKIRGAVADKKRKDVLANREMNKRYPAGWSANQFHMDEVRQIKKKLK